MPPDPSSFQGFSHFLGGSPDVARDEHSIKSKFEEKRHHLLGETVDDSCSTGPGSKQCTRHDGVETVNISAA